MQYLFVFPDIPKNCKFLVKNADFIRNQGVCHMIYIFLYPV